MSARLELIDNGRTFWCFDRRGTKKPDGTWHINSFGGSREIEPGTEVSDWISQKLAERNGSPDPYFVWLNPHAARLLWFEGFLLEGLILEVADGGPRRFRDVFDTGDCFVFPGVPFAVGGNTVRLTVVVSPRAMHQQVSIVNGEVLPEGKINLSRMAKLTKTDAV